MAFFDWGAMSVEMLRACHFVLEKVEADIEKVQTT